MKAFKAEKVKKRTLELCIEEASKEKYITAPLSIYQRIRSHFTTAHTVEEIVNMGYDSELVELIKKEVF